MRLNDRVRHWIDSWTGEERQAVTLRDLLEHASGLPAHRQYFETRQGRASFEMAICEEPLAYPPRTQSIYSDPGFMLLGFAMEHAAGDALDRQFDRWRARELGEDTELRFRPPERVAAAHRADGEHGARRRAARRGARRERARARRRRRARRIVRHRGRGRRLRALVDAVPVARRCSRRRPRCRAVRARLAGTPCCRPRRAARRCRRSAIGHTGFTGTSLWIDPATDLYVVILTNRVHPTRDGEGIQDVRRALHDAIVRVLPSGPALARGHRRERRRAIRSRELSIGLGLATERTVRLIDRRPIRLTESADVGRLLRRRPPGMCSRLACQMGPAGPAAGPGRPCPPWHPRPPDCPGRCAV